MQGERHRRGSSQWPETTELTSQTLEPFTQAEHQEDGRVQQESPRKINRTLFNQGVRQWQRLNWHLECRSQEAQEITRWCQPETSTIQAPDCTPHFHQLITRVETHNCCSLQRIIIETEYEPLFWNKTNQCERDQQNMYCGQSIEWLYLGRVNNSSQCVA